VLVGFYGVTCILDDFLQHAIYDLTKQPKSQTPIVPVQDPNYSPLGEGRRDTASDGGNVYYILSRDNGRAESRREPSGEDYGQLGQKVRLTRSGNSLPLQLVNLS
jgi:hypothetical protein